MLTLAIVLASIIGYIAIGALVFGHLLGAYEHEDTVMGDDPGPLLSGLFWPVTLPFILMIPMLRAIKDFGIRQSGKKIQAKKFRVKIEERLRIEQKKLEEEAEREVEETLRASMKS